MCYGQMDSFQGICWLVFMGKQDIFGVPGPIFEHCWVVFAVPNSNETKKCLITSSDAKNKYGR